MSIHYNVVGYDHLDRPTYDKAFKCNGCGREMGPNHVYFKSNSNVSNPIEHLCPVCERENRMQKRSKKAFKEIVKLIRSI